MRPNCDPFQRTRHQRSFDDDPELPLDESPVVRRRYPDESGWITAVGLVRDQLMGNCHVWGDRRCRCAWCWVERYRIKTRMPATVKRIRDWPWKRPWYSPVFRVRQLRELSEDLAAVGFEPWDDAPPLVQRPACHSTGEVRAVGWRRQDGGEEIEEWL